MATGQGKTSFPLKLLVDEKRNQVVVAEAGKDFIDILFSFLTLPMGTIMRLAGNQKMAENGLMAGMYHLYQSVKDLGDDNFSAELCKSFLLKPRNPLEKYCINLKVQIDDSRFNMCYVCDGCDRTTFLDNVRCRCASVQSYSEISSSSFLHRTECNDVFLKGGTMFIVSDDLQVMPCSPASLIQRLSNLGIDDMTPLKEISLEVGIEEISSLLKNSLFSKSPLTDVFLVKQGKSKNPVMPESRSNLPLPGIEAQNGTSASQLSLKLVLRKSTNTILFAEASGDFVNFLFSFLTIPIGTVEELLKGQTGLECIDNLRKSVENLEPEWLCVDKDTLLNTGVAEEYEYWKHPLGIQTLREWDINRMRHSVGEVISGRFMKTPSKFLVTDDLSLRNLSSTSSIGFIKGLNIPFHDIEDRMVTVGETQALGILKASLTSSSALTNGLNSLLMKPKQEEHYLFLGAGKAHPVLHKNKRTENAFFNRQRGYPVIFSHIYIPIKTTLSGSNFINQYLAVCHGFQVHPLATLFSFLLSPTAAKTSFQSKALILPVIKDTSNLQYVTHITQRTPLVPKKLNVDLGGSSLWVDCEKEYVSSSFRLVDLQIVHFQSWPVACGDSCNVQPSLWYCNKNTCYVFPDNPVTQNGCSGGEVAEDVLSVKSTTGQFVSVPRFVFTCVPTWSILVWEEALLPILELNMCSIIIFIHF